MFAVEITGNFSRQAALNPLKQFNMQAVKLAEKAALDEAQKQALVLVNKTTSTWDTQPRFTARRVTNADGGSVIIVSSSMVWMWLDQGTKVRYAVMTKGFKAKTKVGVLYSYQGAGKVGTVNTKKPRPGIKARGWSQAIMAQVAPGIHAAYREALHTNWISG